MNLKKFDFIEALKFGWEKMKPHFWFSFVVILIFAVLGGISDSIEKQQGKDFTFELALVGMVISLISIFLQMGVTKITLKIYDNQAFGFDDLYIHYRRFLDYFLASVLYILIFIGGLILLIVPGIIWAIKYQFMPYFVMDKNMKPMDALRESAKITAGSKMDLFLFGLLMLLFNLVGLLCLVVGLFFTIPASFIAMAYVYRHLQTETAKEVETVNAQ